MQQLKIEASSNLLMLPVKQLQNLGFATKRERKTELMKWKSSKGMQRKIKCIKEIFIATHQFHLMLVFMKQRNVEEGQQIIPYFLIL